MIRPVLTELALFLAPFVAYAVFLLAHQDGGARPQRPGRRRRWPTLAIVALLLMIGSFIVSRAFLRRAAGLDLRAGPCRRGRQVRAGTDVR